MEEEKKVEMETKTQNTVAVKTIVLIVFIVLLLSGYLYFGRLYQEKGYNTCGDCKPTDKPSSSKDGPSSSTLEDNQIQNGDAKVSQFKSLFSFEKRDSIKRFPSIFSKKILNAGDLTQEHQLSIALNHYIEENLVKEEYATCEQLANSEYTFTCNTENFALVDNSKMIYYRFTNQDIEESFYQIFDRKITIVHQGFQTQNEISCNYENLEYVCYKKDSQPIGIDSVSYIVKAFEYSDRLEIFIKYVWIEDIFGYSNMHKEDIYFDNYFSNPALSTEANVQKNYDEEIPFTKFTFVKGLNGKYYWEKSELVVK